MKGIIGRLSGRATPTGDGDALRRTMAAGRACMRDGRFEQAHDHFAAVVAVAPGRLPARRALAQCQLRLRRFAEAVENFEYVLGIDQADVKSRRGLWRALSGLGKVNDALQHIDRHLIDHPGDRRALTEKATALSSIQRRVEARAVWDDIMSAHGADPQTLLNWAKTFLGSRDVRPAHARLEAALDAAPDDAELLYAAAGFALLLKRWTTARELLIRASADPAFEALAKLQLALVRLELGEPLDDPNGLAQLLADDRQSPRVRNLATWLIRIEPDLAKLIRPGSGPSETPRSAAGTNVGPSNAAPPHRQSDVDIDVVYTWVDMDDPEWLRSFVGVTGAAPATHDDNQRNESRYRQSGEILFSLALLERHFPQARRIYVVTDNQRFDTSSLPARLRSRLTFIDHAEIIPQDLVALPTFNSNVIEAFLHRIPGLSEVFLYLNDDYFIGAPIERRDLFDDNDVPFALVKPARRDFANAEAVIERARNCPGNVIYAARIPTTFRYFRDVMHCPPPAFQPSHAGHILSRRTADYTFEEFDPVLRRALFPRQLRESLEVQWIVLHNLVGLHRGFHVPIPFAKHRRESLVVQNDLHPEIVDFLLERRPKFFCVNAVSGRHDEFARLKAMY